MKNAINFIRWKIRRRDAKTKGCEKLKVEIKFCK